MLITNIWLLIDDLENLYDDVKKQNVNENTLEILESIIDNLANETLYCAIENADSLNDALKMANSLSIDYLELFKYIKNQW